MSMKPNTTELVLAAMPAVHPAPEFAKLVGRFDTDASGKVVQDPPSEFKVQPRDVEVLEPMDDRLAVRPDGAAEMIGSFYVPDVAQERPARGTIVAIGPDVTTLAVGDIVIYGHFTGSEAVHMGEEVLMMRRADVYARVSRATI